VGFEALRVEAREVLLGAAVTVEVSTEGMPTETTGGIRPVVMRGSKSSALVRLSVA